MYERRRREKICLQRRRRGLCDHCTVRASVSASSVQRREAEMLSVENLQFHYQGGPKVLKKINFTLEVGEFLAILGDGGSGKSGKSVRLVSKPKPEGMTKE